MTTLKNNGFSGGAWVPGFTSSGGGGSWWSQNSANIMGAIPFVLGSIFPPHQQGYIGPPPKDVGYYMPYLLAGGVVLFVMIGFIVASKK